MSMLRLLTKWSEQRMKEADEGSIEIGEEHWNKESTGPRVDLMRVAKPTEHGEWR
jgi:hypothetical protein